jgi:nitrite reductase/ring-hydroxylating ferredoxin subunit
MTFSKLITLPLLVAFLSLFIPIEGFFSPSLSPSISSSSSRLRLSSSSITSSRLYSSNVDENAAETTTETTAETTASTPPPPPVFNLKGYTKVYDNVNKLQEGEQFPFVLESAGDKSYLRERFFILLKNQGKISVIDPQCGRCSYPLVNGEIVDEPALKLSDNTSITCKLCGLRHSLVDGSVSRPKSGGTNVIQKIGGVFFNKGEKSDILVHPSHVTETGEVYAKILPRKKITEVMPFQD